jgi:hypothetical protein
MYYVRFSLSKYVYTTMFWTNFHMCMYTPRQAAHAGLNGRVNLEPTRASAAATAANHPHPGAVSLYGRAHSLAASL